MPVYVTIHIPGKNGVTDKIKIMNVGHPDYGDQPNDDDLRLYLVEFKGAAPFTVQHRRSHGRWALVAKVMARLAAPSPRLAAPQSTNKEKPNE